MVHNKRKKNSRQRGSWTHGWGEKKKHRGAGSRGGRGNAGSGKRADVKKPAMQKIGRVFGRNGFINHGANSDLSAINIAFFERADLSGKDGVTISNGVVKVDLGKLGYQKLLGTGTPTRAYEVMCVCATDSALKKIEAAGGKVILPSEK